MSNFQLFFIFLLFGGSLRGSLFLGRSVGLALLHATSHSARNGPGSNSLSGIPGKTETQRTQEFVLRWSPDHGRSFREIVRQQWNFSPPVTIRETEDYAVDLADVTVVELKILPDQSGGTARASLASLRLA